MTSQQILQISNGKQVQKSDLSGEKDTRRKNMKKTMWITTFREIKQSLGRYLAVLAIIALGVGLFAGLVLTKPFMIDTTDAYFKDKNLYDFRLLSTYGFEQEDVEMLAENKEALQVSGAYSYDVLSYYEPAESTYALKMHSMIANLNELELVAGRLPEQENECVVDSTLFGEDAIGETLLITEDNKEDTLEVLAEREYTITGVANASCYIQFERGNTSIGNGKLDGFIYVLPEAFDSDVYTEVFVKLNHELEIYSEEYDAYIEGQESIWEEQLNTVAQLRFERVKIRAQQELDDARAEFEQEKADGEKELADAKKELEDALAKLEDGKVKLEDARQEVADGKKEIEDGKQDIIDGKKEIEDGKKEIEAGKKEIAAAKKEIQAGYAEVEKNQQTLEASEAELNKNKALLEEKEAEFNKIVKEWENNQSKVDKASRELTAQKKKLDQEEKNILAKEQEVERLITAIRNGEVSGKNYAATLAAINKGRQEISEGKAALELGRVQLAAGYEQLEDAQRELDIAKKDIDSGKAQFAEQWKQVEAAEKEIANGKKKIKSAIADLEKGEKEIKQAETDLVKAQKDIEQAEKDLAQAEKDIEQAEKDIAQAEIDLAEAEKELADGELEYQDGVKEYEEGVEKFNKEIAEAEEELADAQKEIDEMDATDCFMLGRDTNVGYVCMENDSQIVEDVSAVFPVFFFLIAALVCMTTMNRMIEEQRTQIGVLKALGYSNSVIMGKYLFYSGSAAGLGCALGYTLGTYCLTRIIWMAYKMMYSMGELTVYWDWKLFAICMFFSLLCSMGTTWFSCRHELFDVAAVLMRPKAPKTGKRVFLEKIPFIWKHLSFLVKVSIRNVFRYKKRFFMMILGISGCMALLVTGFGIKDSIADITSIQYDEILLYDMSVSLKDKPKDEVREELQTITRGDIDEMDFFMETSLDLTANGNMKSVYLIVPENLETLDKYINLHTLEDKAIAYPGAGEAVISHKIADNFGIKIGDTVQLTDENHKFFEVKISGICENFINNYIFMSEETCRELWEKPEYKTIYINVPEENEEMYQLSAQLMEREEVVNVAITKDSEERFAVMMSSLDYIVVLIIGCAAALAFIVLYNLTNINITERIREIATIKVLGFYKKETSSYVFRENVALTAIGAVIGLFLGKVFHEFVMSCIKIDIVAFDVRINPISYMYSVLLTFLFAWIVNMVMSGKIDSISMTESLKSVD